MAYIDDLDPTPGVAGTDLVPSRKGSTDYRMTVEQISDLVLSRLTPAEILNLLQQVDGNTNGVNASTLQGLTSDFFRNASNLNAGFIGESRLPNGNTTSYSSAEKLTLPAFVTGGARIMIQYGITPYYSENKTVHVQYPTPFASGIFGSNFPLFMIAPECNSDAYVNPASRVEVDIRAHQVTTVGAYCSTIRTSGNGSDKVRGHWIAIGRY